MIDLTSSPPCTRVRPAPRAAAADLELLAAVADTGTLEAAARTAGLTRQATGRRLSRMERRLGVDLLTGRPGAVRLTAAGQRLVAVRRRFLAVLSTAVHDITDLAGTGADDPPSQLRLAAEGHGWQRFSDDLALRLPGITLALHQVEPGPADRLFNEHRVDSSYDWWLPGEETRPQPRPARGAELFTVLDEPLWVALPASHPQAGQPRVRLADLAAEHWIVRTSGRSRPLLHAVGAHAGFVPRIGWAVESEPSARSLVSHGHGVALASPLTVPPVPGANLVLRPTVEAPTRRYVLTVAPTVIDTRLGRILCHQLRASYAAKAAQRRPGERDARQPPRPAPTVEAPGEDGDRHRIDVDDVRLLRVIGEYGSLNRAAPALLITQSGLSRWIQRLEQRLGVPLLIRGRRGTLLTPAAHRLVAAVAAAEGDYHRTLEMLPELRATGLPGNRRSRQPPGRHSGRPGSDRQQPLRADT